ncbi:MAG: iron-sulfur cluster assembly accessory protein [Candidatus Aenigmarchaeota archaeon]|nr:iron-sulfur cluster assembly accessory protein [Candidatus Aenigmarchaeota archaeon]
METITKITKDMMIADLVRKHPQSVDVMLKHGLHCFGCGVSLYETIEQGTLGHGMSEEQLNAILEDLNNMEPEEGRHQNAEEGFAVTEKAAAKAREFMQRDGKQEWGLRVGVSPGGCSGFTYVLDFEQGGTGEDMVFVQHGIKFFISKADMEHLGGSTLDYLETLQGAGFKIHNPNVKTSCGCGKSFR